MFVCEVRIRKTSSGITESVFNAETIFCLKIITLYPLFKGLTGFDSKLKRYVSMPGLDRTARKSRRSKL